MPVQLQPLLSAWLDKQMSGFTVWVDRQLQQEDWKPLGLEQVCYNLFPGVGLLRPRQPEVMRYELV
jgi:hypothetical protein